jgi:hypothetical protein
MSGSNPSGNIQNPVRRYFLKIATYAVRPVNLVRGNGGITYGRKAVIRYGMALDLCGMWRVGQLSTELQDIIMKYPQYFVGEPEPPMGCTPGEVDEEEEEEVEEEDDDDDDTSKYVADVMIYRRVLCLLRPCGIYWACGNWRGRRIIVGHTISREAPRKRLHSLVWHTLYTVLSVASLTDSQIHRLRLRARGRSQVPARVAKVATASEAGFGRAVIAAH